MARLAGVNVPSNKRLVIALSYIFGIGKKFSNDICESVNIDKNKRVNSLTEDEIIKISDKLMKNGLNISEISRVISHDLNIPKRDVYQLLIKKRK